MFGQLCFASSFEVFARNENLCCDVDLDTPYTKQFAGSQTPHTLAKKTRSHAEHQAIALLLLLCPDQRRCEADEGPDQPAQVHVFYFSKHVSPCLCRFFFLFPCLCQRPVGTSMFKASYLGWHVVAFALVVKTRSS